MTEPFQFSNGQLARNGEDLIKLCQQFPDDATNYLVREDFEKWLVYIGETQFAQCAATARQIDSDARQKLETFVNRCQVSVATPPLPATTTSPEVPTPAPSTPTNSEPTNKVAATPKATQATTVSTNSSINATDGPQTPPAEPTPESPKVSLLAIISQFIYNILSNRGRANPDSLKRKE